MLRIAFITLGNSRRSNYLNGDSIRTGGGGASGTDTTNIIVAEELAKLGYEVVVATEELEPQLAEKQRLLGNRISPEKTIRGVRYCNMNFDGIENKVFDVLHTCLWFNGYKSLPIKVTKALIYHSHMQWIYSISEMLEFVKDNGLKLGFVHISEWERGMTGPVVQSAMRSHLQTKSTIIPNPVMDEMITEVLSNSPKRNSQKFVFHAAWARGGNVALQAVRELNYPSPEFHAFDYLMATHDHQDSFFHRHNGVDKKTLFTNIAQSEYFIYPLYTPYQDVHKDTFSCVVAEAIALGAIVVTYPLGALPEYYDGYCAWLDFPPLADPKKMQTEPLSKDEAGIFTCTNNIVEKIRYLDAHPEIKASIRDTGKEYILQSFNSAKIGSMWDNFITDLLS